MKQSYIYQDFPRSRIATIDTFDIGLRKHHVIGLLEFDVTESREKIRTLRKKGYTISFTAFFIKSLGDALQNHKEAASYLAKRNKLVIFDSIHITVLIEKNVNDKKVPLPLLIENVQEKNVSEITLEIDKAKGKRSDPHEIVLNRKPGLPETIYYFLPGIMRRWIWLRMLRNPWFTFRKMGNIAVTPVGMMGTIKGWFIHRSIHPLSLGMGSVIKKPVVLKDEIKIREILHVTALFDHDVIDGAPMVRFLNEFTKKIENGYSLNSL